MIREFLPEDLSVIKRINDEQDTFGLPDSTHPLTLIKKTIVEDGKIRGALFGQVICDFTLVLDTDLARFSRAKILAELVKLVYPELIIKGFDELQAFCTQESLANALEKHLEFRRVDGTTMRRKI